MKKFFSRLGTIAAVFSLVSILGMQSALAQLPPLTGSNGNNTGVDLPAVPPVPSVPNPVAGGSVPAVGNNTTPNEPPVPNGANNGNNSTIQDGSNNQMQTQPVVSNTGASLSIGLPASHGLPGSNGVNAVLNTVIGNILSFVALIAIVGLVYSGIQLFSAQGKADAIGNAKQNIMGIIIGFVIVMLAWSGVNILLRFIGFTH